MDVQMKTQTAQQVGVALKRHINKEMIYNVSAAVSNAILVTLGMGLLMQSISKMVDWAPLYQMGSITMILLPAAFGAAVASQMKRIRWSCLRRWLLRQLAPMQSFSPNLRRKELLPRVTDQRKQQV